MTSTLRILVTADNHIGLKFGGRPYPAELRADLIEERFAALERAVRLANEHKVHCTIIAGDLFDSVHASSGEIQRIAKILRLFEGPHLAVLPGNHDFYEPGEGTLWQKLSTMLEGRLLLLCRQEPFEINIDDQQIVLFPGPCTSKHSQRNAIGWVKDAPKQSGALNIGVAHGSVEGISPDDKERYYPMTGEELRQAGVDCWLIGHTHLRYPSPDRASGSQLFIPSTHTPDGFDCKHEGFVWLLNAGEQKRMTAESLRTGAMRFLDWRREVFSEQDCLRVLEELKETGMEETLLRLVLTGRMPEEEKKQMASMESELRQSVRYLEFSADEVGVNIDKEFVDRHFASGTLSHRLLSALATEQDGDLALQLAYGLIQEASR